jgi:capsule polysaccharide export protein KpsE/RkpR
MELEKAYFNLFVLIKKKIKTFIIVGIVAVIFAVVFSSPYFIPPKYKSEAAVYPSNLIQYSEESSTEQMLQLFEGNDIRDSIIQKFDLLNHYDIDSSSANFMYLLRKEYASNVSVRKTNFESVVIKVADTDPVIARDIVINLITQMNKKVSALHREKAKEVVVICEDQILVKKQLIDTLEAQIKRYSIKYGLLDYIQQSREVTAGYMKMLLENKKGESMQKAEGLYNNMKSEGRYFHDLHHQLNLAREEYNKLLIKYDESVKNVNKELTYTNVVVYPEVADKKSYPIRWLVVVLSLFVALFFTFIVQLFSDRIKANN